MLMQQWNNIIADMKLPKCNDIESYKSNWITTDNKGDSKVWKDREDGATKTFLKAPKNQKFLSKQVRSVIFVIHNPFKYYDSPGELETLLNDWKGVDKSIVSIEIGKKGETLHFQGFIKFRNVTKYKTIISKLQCEDIDLRFPNGSLGSQFKYVTKIEPMNKADKIVYMKGDWNEDILSRESLNVTDFVDWLILNKRRPTKALADKYCDEYRKGDNNRVMSKIGTTYNDRRLKNEPLKRLPTITFSGNSGCGKSLITKWVIDKIGYNFRDHVIKKEANAHTKKLWFTPDIAYKPILFLSEINYYFPNKTNLLSLLDNESQLEIKGSYVDNTLELLFMNTTALTPYFIYGITQNATAYTEISRRLDLDDSQYFVKPNPLWTNKLLHDMTPGDIVEQYPPKIYKMIEDPGYIKHNVKNLTDEYKIDIEFINEENLRINYSIDDRVRKYYGEYDDIGKMVDTGYTSIAHQYYKVKEVTKEDIVAQAKALIDWKNLG